MSEDRMTEGEVIKKLYELSNKTFVYTGMNSVIDLISNQQKEIEKLKEIIIAIRHELKGNVITKDDNNYAPAKNLTKQEVYESYVKLSLLLKANYIFKEDEDVIKELLEE